MAANLIYTFSYGSIGSCHVCTTWAVCLCVLALYGHCAWDRPGPSDIFSAENIRSRSTSRKRRMHFNSISTKQTEAHASKYSSQSHGHALYCLVCTIIQPDMEIKSDSPMGHLMSLCQLLKGFTLIINQGHHSRETHSSISEQKQYNASQRGTVDQYFASSAKWHSVASVIDVQNDNYSSFRNKPLLNGIWWN